MKTMIKRLLQKRLFLNKNKISRNRHCEPKAKQSRCLAEIASVASLSRNDAIVKYTLLKISNLILAFLLLTCIGLLHAAPVIYLLVDTTNQITIAQGQPIVITAGIADFQAQLDAAENSARKAHLEYLKEQLENDEITEDEFKEKSAELETLSIVSTTFGKSVAPWFEQLIWQYSTESNEWDRLQWETHLLLVPKPEPVAQLDNLGASEAAFGVDPEITNGIRTGNYVIRILLPPLTTDADTLWSNTIEIKIEKTKGPSEEWPFGERLLLAYYWVRRGEYQKALDEVEPLVNKEPTNINALQVKADALAGLGRFEEAADVFLDAIGLFESLEREHSCPPDYLIDRYIEMIDQLGERRLSCCVWPW